ncbi:MAG TPA: patatin-like phospholipase family protein [Acidimicrobiia bacterium]|nr:patatin-like phospholipase family protein [Acidimicrobiia bacterium]
MTVAIVLSGGASLGAVEVGMLAALQERGVRPDLVVGTSVGALNGAWLAGHPDEPIDALGDVWRALRRSSVFPANPLQGLLGFAGRRRGLVSQAGLRRLISRYLTFDRLEDAPVPLRVVAVDVLTGHDVVFSSGPAAEAILASAAIPAVFAPVTINDVPYMDGGVVNNTPISHAVQAGADVLWVLSAGYACALDKPPRGALAMGLHALTLLLHQQLIVDVERYEGQVELHVVPPLCPLRVSPADFSRSGELIERAHEAASHWLDEEHPPVGQAEFMGLHRHHEV